MQSVLREMGTTRLLVMAGVALLMLAIFGFLAFRISSPNMVPLYSNLSAEDSNGVVSQLAGMGIQYEVQSGGAQIMVPADQVPVVRARMAGEGLPSKGAIVGYEIFDKSELMGSSHFVQNVNLVRALEGELGRTLRGFAKISEARVHLVLPKRELFSRADQHPTASVMVKVKGGQTLDRAEVAAISHLVASAVPGLSPLRVTIVDVKGNPLKLATDKDDEPGLIAATSEEYRMQFQNHMKKKIEELLERSVGAGRVVAQVSADIDFDRVVTNAEIYDPDGQVIRSIQAVEEKEFSQDGKNGDVSVQNNLPAGSGGQNNSASASGSSLQRTNETTNYEISKTVKNHVSESGSVKKLSVAVLVDGVYTKEAEEEAYQPRSAEELQKLEGLVKTAIGFDEARGDQVRVENMAFSRDEKMTITESPFAWLTQDIGGVVQTLVVGVVVTLIILLVIRPVVGRAFEISKSDTEDAELQAALAGMSDMQMLAGEIENRAVDTEEKPSIDIERFEEKMKSSSLGTVNEIVERHPDETLTIIRNWLGQEANS